MRITQSTVGEVAIFRIDGHVDSRTSSDVQSAIEPALEADPVRLAIDFRSVTYVSSAGLRVVLMIAKRARAAGGTIVIFGLNNPVREVFEISGFDRIVPIVGTEAEAVGFARP